MISVDLARRLTAAGLRWIPEEGDRFVIPDRNLDGDVFSVSEMTIQVDDVLGTRRISFNGAVEWALDSIEQGEVVWLPSEAQVREALGPSFESLERTRHGYRCSSAGSVFEASEAADAYGEALLAALEERGRTSSA